MRDAGGDHLGTREGAPSRGVQSDSVAPALHGCSSRRLTFPPRPRANFRSHLPYARHTTDKVGHLYTLKNAGLQFVRLGRQAQDDEQPIEHTETSAIKPGKKLNNQI